MPSQLIFVILIALIPFSFSHASTPTVLIFGQTVKPAHLEIIPVAGQALETFINKNGFEAHFTQNPELLITESLKKYDALIFLDTSEKVLSSELQSAVEFYHQGGRGILAIHSSIALGNDWPWFKALIGTSFKSHPPIHFREVKIKKTQQSWMQNDEWYEFAHELDSSIKIIATANDEPVSWCREQSNAGRFWYTAMGHSAELYTGAGLEFMEHLLAGLRWVTIAKPLNKKVEHLR